MTEHDGNTAQPTPGTGCDIGAHRGWAGHVLLTYPSGGRILASAGHWVELSRIDVSETDLHQAAASFGAAFQSEVQGSLAACATPAERQHTVQMYSAQMVQQSLPSMYSGSANRPS